MKHAQGKSNVAPTEPAALKFVDASPGDYSESDLHTLRIFERSWNAGRKGKPSVRFEPRTLGADLLAGQRPVRDVRRGASGQEYSGDHSDRQRNDVRSFEAVINRGRKAGEPSIRLAVHGLENGELQLWSGAPGDGSGQRVLRVVRALEQTFGKRIIFVKSSGPVSWGARSSPELANAILVNIERDNPMLVLIGHELGHNMQCL